MNKTTRINGIGTLVTTEKSGSSLTLTREASKRWHGGTGPESVSEMLQIARDVARHGSGSCGIFDADGVMLRNIEER